MTLFVIILVKLTSQKNFFKWCIPLKLIVYTEVKLDESTPFSVPQEIIDFTMLFYLFYFLVNNRVISTTNTS
jgi:hypothetical protein